MEAAKQTTDAAPQAEQVPEQQQEIFGSGPVAGGSLAFEPPADNANSRRPQPSLTPSNILKLQRTIGNRAVQRLIANSRQPAMAKSAGQIQRVLIPESVRAFDSAIPENSNYADAKADTDAYMPKDYQEKLTNVTGRATKIQAKFVKDQQKKDLKDFVRAYLLKQASEVLHNLYNGDKYKDLDKKGKDKKVKDYLTRSLFERDKYAPLLNMGVAAPETKAFLKSQGFEDALGVQATDQQNQAVLDKGPHIDVRSTFIGGAILGVNLRAHLFIVYTGSDGKQFYLRGGPSEPQDGHPYGYTRADYGPYEQDTVDFDPSAPSVTVLEGDAAAAKIDAMIDAAKSVNDMKVPYVPRGTGTDMLKGENCNGTAYTILQKAGVPTKKPNGVHPGWGAILGTYSGKGNAFAAQEDGAPTPTKLQGTDKDEIPFFRDQEALEPLPGLKGGSTVTMLVPDPDKLPAFVKINSGDKTGYVHKMSLQNHRIMAPGRKFKVSPAEKIVDVLAIDSNIDVGELKGGDIIEVLDDSFDPNDDTQHFQQFKIRFGAGQLGRLRGMYMVDLNYTAPQDEFGEEEEETEDLQAPEREEIIVADPQEDNSAELLGALGAKEDETEDLQKETKVIVPVEGAERNFRAKKNNGKAEIVYILEKNGVPSQEFVADGDWLGVMYTNFVPGKKEWDNVLVKVKYEVGGIEDVGYLYGRNIMAQPEAPKPKEEVAVKPPENKPPETGHNDDITELEEIPL